MRNLQIITSKHFDLLVIGGGINGACIAWDAALRGLSVALVDKGDFGAATSAATGKMIHGGIRYLQHLALGRVKASLHERRVFLRIAPHLVRPVPFLIPTYGHGLKGKEVLTLAMIIYDLLARTEGSKDPRTAIPGHQRLSRRETLAIEPHLSSEGLTGAIRFFDCQMPSSERLTLSFVLSAQQQGAVAVNYLQAKDLLLNNGYVIGVNALDTLTGQEQTIRAKVTVNAAGPWATVVLKSGGLAKVTTGSARVLSKGIHIITRALTNEHALALATRHKHSGAWLGRGGRHFFIVPWQGLSLIGTTNSPFSGDLDGELVTEEDIQGLIRDVNSVYPAAGLCREDVRFFYGGLYPDDPAKQGGGGYQGAREDSIIDHAASQGVNGLISIIGVKYTTARRLAQKVVDLAFRKLERPVPVCQTETTALIGGNLEELDAYIKQESQRQHNLFLNGLVSQLIRTYGTSYASILELCGQEPRLADRIVPDKPVIKAQVLYAVRREMALTLKDVIFRRTNFGLFGHPGKEALHDCAMLMTDELGWDSVRLAQEILATEECYLAQ